MIAFHHIRPDLVDYLPREALKMLDSATRKTPSPVLGVNDILVLVKHKYGSLYVVDDDSKIVGVLFLDVCTGEYGRTLNIIEAAGKLSKYRVEFMDFIKQCMQENNCTKMVCITRHAMGKFFPEWKTVGTMYEYRP